MEHPLDFWNYLLMRLLLLTVALTHAGCTGPAKATDARDKGTSDARKLYIAKCAKCHKFYDPAAYSDAEWRVWMTKMSKKAKLKPAQEEFLSRYIDATFRTAQKPEENKNNGTQ